MMNAIEKISYALENESDLDPLIDQAGTAAAVLIGGSTHGTSEFYAWRAKVTQRLISEKGFAFVAIEGDWPDCYRINHNIRMVLDANWSARDALSSFNRWPTWLWANQETLDFIEWLAHYNKELPVARRIGFYGLDLYSIWESLNAVAIYLENTVPETAAIAKQALQCFESYQSGLKRYPLTYPLTTELEYESCEKEATRLLSALEHLPPIGDANAAEERLNVEQNALVVADAERYFRLMRGDGPESWNVREEHMAHAFFHLLNFYGKDRAPKGIIWAHNAHVGDSRATSLAQIDRVSIGQLVRDALSVGDTYIIGFGTYQGSLIAAADWHTPPQQMVLPPALRDSWESAFHEFDQKNKLVLFSKDKEAARVFAQSKDHRLIGVVYDSNAEFGNYVPAILRDRYDAFLYIDTTSALHPLQVEPKAEGPPSTFPSAA